MLEFFKYLSHLKVYPYILCKLTPMSVTALNEQSLALVEPPSDEIVKSIVEAIERDEQLLLQKHDMAMWELQEKLTRIAMQLYGRKGSGDVHLFTRVAVALYLPSDESEAKRVIDEVRQSSA